MNELSVGVAGETLVTHAERALWWPRRRALLVADVHLGKGAVLRRAGVAVPSGQTAHDLQRLDRLIAHYRPARFIVLGDLVHGPAPDDSAWIAQARHWRERHADVAMSLVAGNHDRHFDARGLGFEIVEGEITLEPFTLRHAPDNGAPGYVLAGHVHPAVAIHDGWRRHRLPAFRFGAHGGLLPAFGTLTGLHQSPREPGEQVVVVTPGGLVALPAAGRAQGRWPD